MDKDELSVGFFSKKELLNLSKDIPTEFVQLTVVALYKWYLDIRFVEWGNQDGVGLGDLKKLKAIAVFSESKQYPGLKDVIAELIIQKNVRYKNTDAIRTAEVVFALFETDLSVLISKANEVKFSTDDSEGRKNIARMENLLVIVKQMMTREDQGFTTEQRLNLFNQIYEVSLQENKLLKEAYLVLKTAITTDADMLKHEDFPWELVLRNLDVSYKNYDLTISLLAVAPQEKVLAVASRLAIFLQKYAIHSRGEGAFLSSERVKIIQQALANIPPVGDEKSAKGIIAYVTNIQRQYSENHYSRKQNNEKKYATQDELALVWEIAQKQWQSLQEDESQKVILDEELLVQLARCYESFKQFSGENNLYQSQIKFFKEIINQPDVNQLDNIVSKALEKKNCVKFNILSLLILRPDYLLFKPEESLMPHWLSMFGSVRNIAGLVFNFLYLKNKESFIDVVVAADRLDLLRDVGLDDDSYLKEAKSKIWEAKHLEEVKAKAAEITQLVNKETFTSLVKKIYKIYFIIENSINVNSQQCDEIVLRLARLILPINNIDVNIKEEIQWLIYKRDLFLQFETSEVLSYLELTKKRDSQPLNHLERSFIDRSTPQEALGAGQDGVIDLITALNIIFSRAIVKDLSSDGSMFKEVKKLLAQWLLSLQVRHDYNQEKFSLENTEKKILVSLATTPYLENIFASIEGGTKYNFLLEMVLEKKS